MAKVLDKRNEFINRSLRMYHIRESFPHFLSITDNEIALFVKDKKYQVQQEYRFVVYTLNYRHKNGNLKLNVSDDLRKLMYPVQ